jgi:excisionase family DNA binding protein
MAIHHNSHKRTTEHSAVPRLAFSMHEAATALGLSPGKIRLMVEAGELAAVHAGRRRLIPKTALENFLSVSD